MDEREVGQMILQSAFQNWFHKGRKRTEEALEVLEQLREERERTSRRLQNIISQLDGEDRWFVECGEQPKNG